MNYLLVSGTVALHLILLVFLPFFPYFQTAFDLYYVFMNINPIMR